MVTSILLAQAISLLLGPSAEKFRLAGKSSFSAGIFPGWFLLFLAPLVEEMAWHFYGTDCLRKRMSLRRSGAPRAADRGRAAERGRKRAHRLPGAATGVEKAG